MRTAELDGYKRTLLKMRDRVTVEANYVIESIQEDGESSNSRLPRHVADIARESLDADLQVLRAEHGMLEDIQTALGSIRDGSYGQCKQCGSQIVSERLEAIPFTTVCIECARKDEHFEPLGPDYSESNSR